jgi:hypothetical protein
MNYISDLDQALARIQEQDELIEHLQDLIFELEQNVLAAQDQNHYYKLACSYRDKYFELLKSTNDTGISK